MSIIRSVSRKVSGLGSFDSRNAGCEGETGLDKYRRILVVERHQDVVDRVTSLLEGNAYIVTSTVSDDVALDLAGSADFDALVIGSGMPHSDMAYLREEVRRRKPGIEIVVSHGTESVLTLLRQAFKDA